MQIRFHLLNKNHFRKFIFAGLSLFALIVPNGYSADTNQKLSVFSLKQPFSWLQLGFDLRIRQEYHLNAYSLNDQIPDSEYSYSRFRPRFSLTVKPAKGLDLNARLVTEPRIYYKPTKLQTYQSDEIFFDTLNATMHKQQFTLTAGRQDMNLGNGWLIFEGTPGDGSRSFFFDAVRLNINLKPKKTAIDLIGIGGGAYSDSVLSPFNNKHKSLMEQNETGAIFYLTNQSLPRTKLESYFIYKHDSRVLAKGDQGSIYVWGGALEREITKKIKFRSELAPQWGDKNGQTVRALGTNSRLSFSLGGNMKPVFRLGYEFLSGDDPQTKNRQEGFDPLWGRYPQWSDLYYFTMTKEARVGEWTNLQNVDFGWTMNLLRRLEVIADYRPLFSVTNPKTGNPGFSVSGKFRGNFESIFFKYKLSENVSSRLQMEFFQPGGYYSASSQTPAMFIRAELNYKW